MTTNVNYNGTQESATIAAEATRSANRAFSGLLTDPGRAVKKSIKAIDYNTVWYPALTVAKASGLLTEVSDGDIGAGPRVKVRDDKVQFSKSGRPLFELPKPVVDTCNLMHRAMVYQCLQNPVEAFRAANPEAFAEQTAAQERAAQALLRQDAEAVLMASLENDAR